MNDLVKGPLQRKFNLKYHELLDEEQFKEDFLGVVHQNSAKYLQCGLNEMAKMLDIKTITLE
jgi:hypothetical protein